MDHGRVMKAHLNQEQQLSKQNHIATKKEEEHWHLKSYTLWLKASDQNTSFFHKK